MKKLIKKIETKCNEVAIRTDLALHNNKGEGYVDSALKIVIAVVIGALLLGGLYTLFNETVIPNMTDEIGDLFGYTG